MKTSAPALFSLWTGITYDHSCYESLQNIYRCLNLTQWWDETCASHCRSYSLHLNKAAQLSRLAFFITVTLSCKVHKVKRMQWQNPLIDSSMPYKKWLSLSWECWNRYSGCIWWNILVYVMQGLEGAVGHLLKEAGIFFYRSILRRLVALLLSVNLKIWGTCPRSVTIAQGCSSVWALIEHPRLTIHWEGQSKKGRKEKAL